jgi:hypothetical protein
MRQFILHNYLYITLIKVKHYDKHVPGLPKQLKYKYSTKTISVEQTYLSDYQANYVYNTLMHYYFNTKNIKAV